MKIAVIFDDLVQYGGAERLFLAVCSLWPTADIYTTVVSKDWEKRLKKNGTKYQTSFLQKFPYKIKLNRFYAALHLHSLAFSSFDLSTYDLVFSMSTRFSHNVITKPSTKHICYMNSPGRMFWEPSSYFYSEFSQSSWLKKIALVCLKPFLLLHRLSDYTAAKRVDHFIANSKTPQLRIRKYYGRESTVIYPFVEEYSDGVLLKTKQVTPYYLIVSRLVSWKRIDIAIKSCNKLNLHLKIIGTGPDMNRLKRLAGPTIEFLGYVSEKRKVELYASCEALINTQLEDFGIVPLEAMLYGRPVIAYGKGGALETVREHITGEFFYFQNEDALSEVLTSFDSGRYNPEECLKIARTYSKAKFLKEIAEFVNSVY